jgi:hypothetical protein
MEPSQIVLKLVLDNLGVSDSIAAVDDRKRIQKAVYLAQAAGVNLSYVFGWYVMGPYSPALTRDYYSLASALDADDKGHVGKALRPDLKDKLDSLQPLIEPPPGIDLSQEDWLELLASIHFLLTVSKFTDEESRDRLDKEKQHLVGFFDQGKISLRSAGLLG